MYKIKKRLEVSGAHKLTLNYESKCTQLHGHNWLIDIYLRSDKLNPDGMVMDFTNIKRDIQDVLDHKYINDVIQMNPTAENIAKWICDKIGVKCYRVKIRESEGNIAEYERP